jgi:hypothetical protein
MFKTIVVTALISMISVVIPVTWWAFDRTPPYDRIFGRIIPEEPHKCDGANKDIVGVLPGACVAIEWTIKINRTDCQPMSSYHVDRTITDESGTHILPPTENVFGNGKRPFTNPLRRPFVLPEWSLRGKPASYHSEACFSCNPLHWAINWPVCLTKPDAYYEVE